MQRSSRMKKRYIHGFDGLRALAVIAVILYHLNPDVFKGGYLGVPIFMVLSGYLITDHMLLSLSTTGHFSFKDFWLRRIKRLYPALLAMLLTTSAYIVLFQRNLLGNLHKIVISNFFMFIIGGKSLTGSHILNGLLIVSHHLRICGRYQLRVNFI